MVIRWRYLTGRSCKEKVPGEAEGGLREVIGAEGEEVGVVGNVTRDDAGLRDRAKRAHQLDGAIVRETTLSPCWTRPRQLDHRADRHLVRQVRGVPGARRAWSLAIASDAEVYALKVGMAPGGPPGE